MRSVERLEKQKQLKRQQLNRPEPDMEMEEEMEFPQFVPMNKMRNAFDDRDKHFGGINTAPSVFDQKAVIRTE